MIKLIILFIYYIIIIAILVSCFYCISFFSGNVKFVFLAGVSSVPSY